VINLVTPSKKQFQEAAIYSAFSSTGESSLNDQTPNERPPQARSEHRGYKALKSKSKKGIK
jgi:hypothetical protein